MHPLVEKYGKQPMQELMDRIIISGKMDNTWLRFWLIKANVLSPRSKAQIRGGLSKGAVWETVDGKYGQVPGATRYRIWAKNGRSEHIILLNIDSREIPQILEDLK